VRILFTALAMVVLLDLIGCSGLGTAQRDSACTIEASLACQMERTARVP
jgi:hypothetical protein